MHVALSTDAEGAWASDALLVEELREGGVQVDAIGDTFHRDVTGLAAAAAALRATVGEWRAPVVAHAHTAMTGVVARWAGAPVVVVTCHGWDLQRPAAYDLQDALALAMASAVISPSTDWARRVAAMPAVGNVYAITNGFDLSRYPATGPRQPHGGAPRIVCVGELTRRKGQDLLVQAMPRVWQAFPGATLELIGDGDQGEAIRTLAREVDTDGDRIRVLGHLPRPYERIAAADVFCLPSRSDNQPVAIIEAMCASVPVLATDVGGIPELVAGADAGIVVPADSVEALADGLTRMLGRDDLATLGARGADFARREYDVRLMADRIDAVYLASGVDVGSAGRGDAAVVRPLRQS